MPMLDSAPGSKGRADGSQGLADRQAAFAEALLDPDKAVPPGLVGPDGLPSAKRFAVYRNNVVAGLVETLKAAFPVVHRLVGEEFFAAMARVYATKEPSLTPIMIDYGAGFPNFIERFKPATVLRYLPDVARLERAWVEAYHASDATPLPPADLADVAPGDLPSLRLALHPSMRVVRSVFPVVAIWQANIGDGGANEVSLSDGENDILVSRPQAEVEVRVLPAGAAAFIEALQADASVVEAMKRGLSRSPYFDLAASLTGLIEAGAIVGFHAPANQSQEIR